MKRPVRRGQAISPFGPGAMVDFPGSVSLIHAGLDAWGIRPDSVQHDEFKIADEWRLSTRLGVECFYTPPDFRQPQNRHGMTDSRPNLNIRLPFLTFPLWHECPKCNRMHKAKYHDGDPPFCEGPLRDGSWHKKQVTYQVRFVAACRKGHIQDFPWIKWVMDGNDSWTPDANHWLQMGTMSSASLSSIKIYAMKRDGNEIIVEKEANLGLAFNANFNETDPSKTPLGRIGAVCDGSNPVMATGDGHAPHCGCGEPLFALLRNASNVYFPDVISSIFIPFTNDEEIPKEIADILEDENIKNELRRAARANENDGLVTRRSARLVLERYRQDLDPQQVADAANRRILHTLLVENTAAKQCIIQNRHLDDGQITRDAIKQAISHVDRDWMIDPDFLLNLVVPVFEELSKFSKPDESSEQTETAYRFQEYKVFTTDQLKDLPKDDLLIERRMPKLNEGVLRSAMERIGLVHKLRETRAFRGFSRIQPFSPANRSSFSLFKSQEINWLPAIVVRGEGIFLEFKKKAVDQWVDKNAEFLKKRMDILQEHVNARSERIGDIPEILSPAKIMLHTFAHVIINEFVYECGYGSASLRERIYFGEGEEAMLGVLVYTAAGDSEGTMGGLVRMGEEERLEEIVRSALRKSIWCSSDPICIESTGQGPENCNLAACHNCGLLPETSCELGNRLLDRAMLVGTLDKPDSGFFSMEARSL